MIDPSRESRIRDAVNQRLSRVSIALEAVYHRHNISAILRTADSLGIGDVHLISGRYRPAKGAGRGAERWLDIHKHRTAVNAIAEIKSQGRALYIADLSENSITPSEVPTNQPLTLWFGAELVGVGQEAREAADGVVSVPMLGLAQSLNVSVAAAMVMQTVALSCRAQGPEALLSAAEKEKLLNRWFAREEKLLSDTAARSLINR